MTVMKFGGSSIKNAESIQEVYSIIDKRTDDGKIIIVFSAMQGVTNRLKESFGRRFCPKC